MQSCMQKDMGACTYTGLMPSREINKVKQEVTKPSKVAPSDTI
jgi:hypothetical protein